MGKKILLAAAIASTKKKRDRTRIIREVYPLRSETFLPKSFMTAPPLWAANG
jgi:hypothetical protein